MTKKRIILNDDPEWLMRIIEDDDGDPVSVGGFMVKLHNKICIRCGKRHSANCPDSIAVPCEFCADCPGYVPPEDGV